MCFLCYFAAYIGRLNLSASLTAVSRSMVISDTQAGLFQTVFALVYAVGQVVNGSLADRISTRRYISAGLFLSATCNMLFGLTDSFWLRIVLWGINGGSQSMLWTPIVKLLATWFRDESRERASFGLSMTIVIGHAAAWAIAGALSAAAQWQFAFYVPAGILALVGLAAVLLLRDVPEKKHPTKKKARHADTPVIPLRWLFHTTGLSALLFCAVCNGFVRDGITTWAPTILAQKQSGLTIHSTLLSLLIPLLNLFGILLGKKGYRLFHGGSRRAVGWLLLSSGALVILLLVSKEMGVAVCAVLMGLCCAANYGANPLLTTLIPMEYEQSGRVGLVAGLMDCFIYLGSALAGVATGALSDAAGWMGVYGLWGIFSFLGAALAFLAIRGCTALSEAEKATREIET